jgi:hypothetical protein
LVFPRIGWHDLQSLTPRQALCWAEDQEPNAQAVQRALRAEAQLGYMVASGRYWESANALDKNKLRAIDDLWLAALPSDAMALT